MAELVPGTLEMLILRTLLGGPMHGYGIAQRIRNTSDGVLSLGSSGSRRCSRR